jgi:maltose O-acetyltransferase
VTIGDDVVIGAGSVVLSDIPARSIAAGVPCRVIKPLERESGQPVWSAFNAEGF